MAKAPRVKRLKAMIALQKQVPAVSSVARRRKCGVCGDLVLDSQMTEVAVGPLRMSICEGCVKPAWHVMGILDWVKNLK